MSTSDADRARAVLLAMARTLDRHCPRWRHRGRVVAVNPIPSDDGTALRRLAEAILGFQTGPDEFFGFHPELIAGLTDAQLAHERDKLAARERPNLTLQDLRAVRLQARRIRAVAMFTHRPFVLALRRAWETGIWFGRGFDGLLESVFGGSRLLTSEVDRLLRRLGWDRSDHAARWLARGVVTLRSFTSEESAICGGVARCGDCDVAAEQLCDFGRSRVPAGTERVSRRSFARADDDAR